MAPPDLPVTLPSGDLFIGGHWRPGTGPESISTFPADGSVNVHMRLASAGDVDEAVARAVEAQRDPAWRTMLPHERARLLRRIADGIDEEHERLARIQTRDTGKTLAETRALVASAAGTFRYMAAAVETLEDTVHPSRGHELTMSVHEPIGVVGAITPWNSPIASDAQKLAPALAAGNAVVLKPAPWTPLVSLALAAVCDRAGLPPGLLSVLPGLGADAGERVVRHRDVGRITFTGGTATGRHVAAAAAERLVPATLELGGKSPTIVFDDADLDLAVAGVAFGIFSSTGQSCVAGSRLFVARSVHDEFVDRLVARTEALTIGHPHDPATRIGPLVHADHRDAVESHVRTAIADGATVLTGGDRPTGPGHDQGVYIRPTILAGLADDAPICRHEVFGPVLVVLPFDDEDDLVARANDSVYGLACGLWTRDYRRAWRVARRIDAGTVWVNTYKRFSIAAPFGGMKDSGLGREKGRAAIRANQQQKALYWGLDEEPNPWAG